MIVSIRKFLMMNLLMSIIITTGITTIANYILNQKDIEYHLDALLSQSALAFISLLGNKSTPLELETIQMQLNNIPDIAKMYYHKFYNPYTYNYEDKFQFQLWSKTGQLLIHSLNAPTEPLTKGKLGFSNENIHNQIWRVFTIDSPSSGFILAMAERYDVRAELGNRMARDDLYIMLLIYPLLGLNIWLIIGKGLDSLRRVANEVSHREPNYLEPVDLREVPVEIKPVVDELNDLFSRLRHALAREKRFAADAAHELRTPLAALKTQAQLALKITDPAQQTAIIQKILASVDRSTHVVQQLLTLSRVTAEDAAILKNMSVMDLHKVAVDVIGLQVSNAIEKNIELELIADEKPIMILGNVITIGMLIRNLVDNAIRYSHPSGHVKISLKEADDFVYLIVADNGPGIPAELYNRVFERFYRILGTNQSGSGLGLAIIQEIVNLHDGKIHLHKPTEGTGLEVEIRFPALKPE